MTRVTEQVEECWFYFVGAEPELSYFLLHFNWIAEFDLGNIGRGFFFFRCGKSRFQPCSLWTASAPRPPPPLWPPVTPRDLWLFCSRFLFTRFQTAAVCRTSREPVEDSPSSPAHISYRPRGVEELLPNILQMAKRGQSVTVFCTLVDLWKQRQLKQRQLSFIIKSGHSLEVVAVFFTSNY